MMREEGNVCDEFEYLNVSPTRDMTALCIR